MNDLPAPLVMLFQFDWEAWLAMFWFMILLEFPRYTLSGLAVFIYSFTRGPTLTRADRAYLDSLKISVVVAGHNEADAMEKCLRSLSEQTRRIDEIIVIDDGSTDGMREMIARLRRQGKIHMALCNQVRSGKPSSCNLGINLCSGDIIINLDADCSYDRDAIERLVEPFVDGEVGATTGSIGVRNFSFSSITSWQSIEYLISISMGKRVLNMLDMVVCASGAFGAFRREAMDQVGIMATGPGEDFEMTMRLRRCGWKIRLAPDAWCFTDVPPTLAALVRQRRRWDRDTIRVRMRRFRDVFRPGRRFNTLETFEQIEFLVMNALVTLVFPVYVGWLFYAFGAGAIYILAFVALMYLALDTVGFLMSLRIAGRYDRHMVLAIAPYLLTFNIFNGVLMRFVRLYAYYEEWVHRRSFQDSYSPSRVTNQSPT
jgi:cellulose synthase/poly-beta-1,6-N-acetylglucosamine synthase-like glycosyltransferase